MYNIQLYSARFRGKWQPIRIVNTKLCKCLSNVRYFLFDLFIILFHYTIWSVWKNEIKDQIVPNKSNPSGGKLLCIGLFYYIAGCSVEVHILRKHW